MANLTDRAHYCRNLVAQDDPDRYLASLFAPAPLRPALWGLLAFNQDIAKTRETVTEPTIGLMRLQWWRDTLSNLYAGSVVDGHPIVDVLKTAIHDYKLEQQDFDTLIDAREFDLENRAPDNLQGLEHYADYTTTPLLSLLARVYGVEIDRERLRYLGVAYALTGLMRAVVFHARQKRCYLPVEDLARFNIKPQELYELKPLRDVASVVVDVTLLAQDHLLRATELNDVRMFGAMKALTALYLKQLKSVGFDVFSPRLARPPMFREIRVWLAAA
jgi:NADH dehydrogenase [ubiquinone] 1 alpha subcomplex assembly factor 6